MFALKNDHLVSFFALTTCLLLISKFENDNIERMSSPYKLKPVQKNEIIKKSEKSKKFRSGRVLSVMFDILRENSSYNVTYNSGPRLTQFWSHFNFIN